MKRKQFNIYVRKILKEFGISRELLFTNTKEREVVNARQVLYWACFVHGEFRVGEIVRIMKENGYDIGHSTIIHGINKINTTEDKYNIKLQEELCTH